MKRANQTMAGSALMIALTIAVAIGCYGATAHGAAQRTEIEQLQRRLITENRLSRDLEAELRTRARMPLIERWNEHVLQMSAPRTDQFMGSAVQLVSLVTPPEAPQEPQLRLALAEAPASMPRIIEASLPEQTRARPALIRAAYAPAAAPTARPATAARPDLAPAAPPSLAPAAPARMAPAAPARMAPAAPARMAPAAPPEG